MGGRGASSSGGGGGGIGSPRQQRSDYTPEQLATIKDYTGVGYHVNERIAGQGMSGLSQKDKEFVKNMDDAIAKSGWSADEIQTNYVRGGNGRMVGVPDGMKFNSKKELADYINSQLVGNKVINDGYTSITTKPGTATSFAKSKTNGVVMHYNMIGKGTKGMFVSDKDKPISRMGSGEQETILQRGMATIPLGAWVENGVVHVDVIATPSRG